MKEVKRNLYFLTDDPSRLLKKYGKQLQEAEFSRYLHIIDITSFNQTCIDDMDQSRICVLWIFNIDSIVDDYFTQGAVMHIAYTKQIKIVVCDAPDTFLDIVKKHNIKSTKEWKRYKNLFGYKTDMIDLMSELETGMIPENITVAFVTDNYDWISNMFSKIKNLVDTENEDDDPDGGSYIDVNRKVCIGPHLPKLIQAWIWSVWYAPVKKESYNKPTDDEPVMNTDVDSYVAETVVVKYGSKTVTYLHIVPSMILDLSEIIDGFTEVYVDLATKYATLKFSKSGKFEPLIYNFISLRMWDDVNDDENTWLNIFKNYLTVNQATGGECLCEYLVHSESGVVDKPTNTVVTHRADIRLDALVDIQTIDPFIYFKESTM